MFKVEIKKDGLLTNSAEFETELQCQKWILDNSPYFPSGFESRLIDITSEKQMLAEELQGLKNQSLGRLVLAKIYAINMQKIKNGLLSPTQLQSLLSDESLAIIERLLLNGSLGSAIQLINSMPEVYFSNEQKQIILNFINENK